MCLDDDGELEISPRDELEISRELTISRELGSGDRAIAPATAAGVVASKARVLGLGLGLGLG